jgi:gamma-glutamyltranspeptidase/glutathione hydrolase
VSLVRARHGIAVAPHATAAADGADVLREGGNAIEAAITMAASLSVLYPHMTGLGGDAFWLCRPTTGKLFGIDGSGAAAARADAAFYRAAGLEGIPARGPLAALTVAGAVSSWALAHDQSRRDWNGRLPLARLFAPAIGHAERGVTPTAGECAAIARKRDELIGQPGFVRTFLDGAAPPSPDVPRRHAALAATLRRLGKAGLDDFYRGEIAASLAADLAQAGSPIAGGDLRRQRAVRTVPLALAHSSGTVYNLGAPTQGIASLMILGLYDRLRPRPDVDSWAYVHLLVEATKQAFRVRDRWVRDPRDLEGADLQSFLDGPALAAGAARIDAARASRWRPGDTGDTTWFGAVDREGRAVSAIQSLYHEFGSGVVLPGTGICWQNRGCAFDLDPASARFLRPRRKPFHTLNPAIAELADGRLLVYGTMGGDGQPQTQAAVYTRYATYGQALDRAIAAPRWVIGRTWGAPSAVLKLEPRFPAATVEGLRTRGHEVELVDAYDSLMGHAGALVRHPDGTLEGASDPRSDGAAVLV